MEVTTTVMPPATTVESLPTKVSDYLSRALFNLYCAEEDLAEAYCKLNAPDFVDEVCRDVGVAIEALREMGVE